MALLIAATVLVIASHVVPSAPGLRERLIGTFGRSGFYAGYSLLSLLTLGLLIWAYRAAGPQDWLYTPFRPRASLRSSPCSSRRSWSRRA